MSMSYYYVHQVGKKVYQSQDKNIIPQAYKELCSYIFFQSTKYSKSSVNEIYSGIPYPILQFFNNYTYYIIIISYVYIILCNLQNLDGTICRAGIEMQTQKMTCGHRTG